MLDFYGNVISQDDLNRLSKYKYSAQDHSPISKYILSHYWSAAVKVFPLWMAPNLITMLGFVFVFMSYVLMLVYGGLDHDVLSPSYKEMPSWVFFVFSASIWLYSTFDNVDGKQARRTNSSSPLGELFDHGIDALNCSIGSFLQACVLGYGKTYGLFGVIVLTCSNFFIATWETYYTGQLYLGFANGPTEGIIISCVTMIISGIYGVHFWIKPISDFINVPVLIEMLNNQHATAALKYIKEMSLRDFMLTMMVLLAFLTQIPGSIGRVWIATGSSKKNIRLEAFLNLIPYLLLLLSVQKWVFEPSSVVIPDFMITFMLCFGITNAKIITMIILAHVTHSEYPVVTNQVFPFIAGSIMVNWHNFSTRNTKIFVHPGIEQFLVMVFWVTIVSDYIFWNIKVVDQFCKHLGIKCFTIPYGKVSVSSSSTTEKKIKSSKEKRAKKSEADPKSPRKASSGTPKKSASKDMKMETPTRRSSRLK